MNKKIVIVLTMLIALTVHLSAQEVYTFFSHANLSEQQFIQEAINVNRYSLWPRVDELPYSIIQTINNYLRNYFLVTGDTFTIGVTYREFKFNYTVYLRITDARNLRWQYYAFCAPYDN